MTYQPFPAFADWKTGFNSTVVDRYAQRLHDVKASSTPEQLDDALTEAMRSAAVDTGAIEGLCTTDRGFTRTVAIQAEMWEMVADEKGAHVRQAIEDAELCRDALEEEFRSYQLFETLDISIDVSADFIDERGLFAQDLAIPAGYALLDTRNRAHHGSITITSQVPTNQAQLFDCHTVVARNVSEDAPEYLVLSSGSSRPLEIWRREIDPVATTSLRLKIDAWAREAATRFVDYLNRAIRAGTQR